MRISLLLSLILFPTLGASAQTWQPLLTDTGTREAAHGVWASRAYGRVLVFSDDAPAVYAVGRAGCLRDEDGSAQIAAGGTLVALGDGTLRLALHPTASTQHLFTRLEALPEACAMPPGGSPRDVFEYVWATMDEHYAFFDLHGVDWQARYDAISPTVTDAMSEAALWDALLALLDGLEDGHLTLNGEVDGQPVGYSGRPPRAISAAITAAFEAQDEVATRRDFSIRWRIDEIDRVERLLGGTAEAVGPLLWGRVGTVGYLRIAGMGGFVDEELPAYDDEIRALNEAMSRAIRDLEDTDGMIIDLVFNQGGYDEVGFAIASHFAAERTQAFAKVVPQAEADTRQAFAVEPYGPLYLKPVVLLTSDVTMSAAEGFTLTMRAFPTVTHAGETTRGALSDLLERPLPNGWTLTLSNEVVLDADGESWERRGIPPDLPMDVFESGNLDGRVDAILALAAQLRRRP